MYSQHAYHWPVFKAVPVLRLLIPFLLGIVVGILNYSFIEVVLFSTSFATVLFLVHFKIFKEFNYQIVLHLLFVWIGWIQVYTHRENLFIDHYSKFNSSKYKLLINSIPETKTKSMKVQAKVLAVNGHKADGKLLLYFQLDAASRSLQYGDVVAASISLHPITNINHSSFDYVQYLANKQIFHQAYLKKNQWTFINHHQGNYFVDLAYNYRNKCNTVLKSSFRNSEAYAVAAALLIGDDDAIPQSVYQAYTNSGTLHVLSV